MTRAKTLSAAAFEPHCVLCRCRCGGDTWETTLKPSFIFFPSAYTWTGARKESKPRSTEADIPPISTVISADHCLSPSLVYGYCNEFAAAEDLPAYGGCTNLTTTANHAQQG
ncbi:hypothetical protein P885DRAFT_56732 [Corynascus similis CBS 632.67]